MARSRPWAPYDISTNKIFKLVCDQFSRLEENMQLAGDHIIATTVFAQ